MKLESEYPVQLRTVLDLYREGNDGEALRLLQKYSADSPYDKEALALLARIYQAAGNVERAFSATREALAIDPDFLPALAIEMKSLIDLKKSAEARIAIERARPIFERLSEEEKKSPLVSGLYYWLPHAYWSVLDDLGEHAAALDIARGGSEDGPGSWYIKLLHSLVANGRLSEAESLRGPSDVGRKAALHHIGVALAGRQCYLDAAQYFLRNLALCRLPREFSSLLAYVEVLLLAGDTREASEVCSYWLIQMPERRRWQRTALALLQSLAASMDGERESARQAAINACGGTSIEQCISRLRPRFTFDDTWRSLCQLVN